MPASRDISHANFEVDKSLALASNEVQLWRVDLAAIRHEEVRWRELLSDDEIARAERFHFPTDRQNFAAGRAWLRMILAGYLCTDPKTLIFAYAKNEKPYLAPPFDRHAVDFNLAHSGGIALYAFARNRHLGVDIEHRKRDFDFAAIARRFFSEHEQKEFSQAPADEKLGAFFRCWTRKEAYIKATGEGLSLPLSQFDVSIAEDCEDALVATRPDPIEATRWRLSNVPAGKDYVAAVCARGRDWILKSWGP